MKKIPDNAVKLDDATRERMRELRRIANAALHEMGEITAEALADHDSARAIKASGLDEVHIVFNNQRDIFIKHGTCVGVYDDPPGICRPCVNGG